MTTIVNPPPPRPRHTLSFFQCLFVVYRRQLISGKSVYRITTHWKAPTISVYQHSGESLLVFLIVLANCHLWKFENGPNAFWGLPKADLASEPLSACEQALHLWQAPRTGVCFFACCSRVISRSRLPKRRAFSRAKRLAYCYPAFSTRLIIDHSTYIGK